MKLYPLQHSRKRRYAPGVDAKEMDLNRFISGRKMLLSFQASEGYGMREGGVEKRRGKEKAEKLNTRKKLTLSPVSLCCPRKHQ